MSYRKAIHRLLVINALQGRRDPATGEIRVDIMSGTIR